MLKILFLFACVLHSTLSFSQQPDSLPVLKLDDKYSELQPKDSKLKPLKYIITSKDGFNLDCSSYDFSLIRSMNNGKDPDAIFIICKAGTYIIELNTASVAHINKSTMQSLDPGNKEFTGFVKDDTPILAIGTLKVKSNQAEMLTYWVAMMEVK